MGRRAKFISTEDGRGHGGPRRIVIRPWSPTGMDSRGAPWFSHVLRAEGLLLIPKAPVMVCCAGGRCDLASLGSRRVMRVERWGAAAAGGWLKSGRRGRRLAGPVRGSFTPSLPPPRTARERGFLRWVRVGRWPVPRRGRTGLPAVRR